MGCHERSRESSLATRPDDNRFTPVVVTPPGALNEPMMFHVLSDESVLIIERGGAFKKWDAATGTMKTVTQLNVFTDSEQGLVGMTIDPNFASNRWIYLYYAPLEVSEFWLTRWEMQNDTLVEGSRKILLKVPSDRESTSHTGGGMTWDEHGNLYLTIGNNTGNSLYSQTDERPGRTQFDDQRGAANTNDLRGKILRIHPESDGTYTIPEGNLFPVGTDKTQPEIFVMGNRNPWRPSIDTRTGFLYWGEIGPDADSDTEMGPMGYDELNEAKGPGFFGWPYFIGENNAYPMYDYLTNTLGSPQDPGKPLNRSHHNTGLTELPAAQPAFISYPYRPSEKFPLVGSSSRCAIGGPVYHRADFTNPIRPFPEYYEGKWLAADLSRFWIMAIEMDEQGNYKGMERFVPTYHPRQPIDIKFGPTGDLYVLEYGGNTANSPVESRLVRMEYNSGNRKPNVQVQADRTGGSVPLVVNLSSEGTVDYDGDALLFDWYITGGQDTLKSNGAKTNFRLEKPGVYTATLTVSDGKGASNSGSVTIVAGNEPPKAKVSIEGNQSFFFPGLPIRYSVEVTDKEDGTLARGISVDAAAFSIDYVSEGFDYAALMIDHGKDSRYAIARGLIAQSDCRTCHNEEVKGVGPSFQQISARYKAVGTAPELLASKIRNGSNGTWGMETAMPAHPTITPANALVIANYILGQGKKEKGLSLKGAFEFRDVPSGDNGRGSLVFRAAYTDRGAGSLPSLFSEDVHLLKSPRLLPTMAEIQSGVIRDQLDEYTFLSARPGSHIAFRQVDLTGVKEISLRPNWHLYDIYKGGTIEIRLGSEKGVLIGQAEMNPKQFNVRYRGAFAPPPGSAEKGVEIDRSLPALDLSKFFGPGSDKSLFTIPTNISIKETSGKQDLYFVFVNTQAKAEESLFPLAYIEFRTQLSIRP
jgi:cytochrome c